jgi:hypothetical protein
VPVPVPVPVLVPVPDSTHTRVNTKFGQCWLWANALMLERVLIKEESQIFWEGEGEGGVREKSALGGRGA